MIRTKVSLLEMPDGRRRHWFLEPGFEELLEVYRADAMGIEPLDLSLYEKIKKSYKSEIAKLKLMPKQLVSGQDVMKILKIDAGKEVGKILKEIRELQLSGELKTPKEAKKFLKEKIKSSS